MKVFKIPSIYTAVDKFTRPMHNMVAANQKFANTLQTGVAKGERLFRKMTPAISETTKQMLSFAKAAAIATAIIGTVSLSTDAILNYEDQLASFRTIVSDKAPAEFAIYDKAIKQVGLETRKSAVDVAMSFEKIAGLNAKLAETSEGLAEVSKASIILAKASKGELGESAESLVGILNQFSFGADQASRTINVLAAGTAVGASSIKQTAEAFVNFGAVASSANITLEQSVALVQVMASKSIYAGEAGNKLKGSLLRLQKAGVGYASGQFQINDALTQVQANLAKMKTPLQRDRYLIKLFGAENISAGKVLLANIGLFKEFTAGVTGTQAATAQAAINSGTLRTRLNELKNTWINLILTNDKSNKGLELAKTVIGKVTDNLGTIVSVGLKVVIFFAAWKAILLATKVALFAYNVVLGVTGALTNATSIAVGRSTVALTAHQIATKAVTAAQWLWNAAMSANPIGLVIIGVAALIGLITVIIKKWDQWGAALSTFLGPLGAVLSIIMSLHKHWDGVVNAFTGGGIIAGIKAIGLVLLDAVLMPMQQIIKLIAKVTGADWAVNAAKGIDLMRSAIDQKLEPSVNGKATQQEATNSTIENIQKQQATLTIQNETDKKATLKSKGDFIPMKLSSTWGQ